MERRLRLLLLIPNICFGGQFLGNPDMGNMSYLNDRYLSHSTGRFISQDHIKQFKSHYAYGDGHIIKYSDPSGDMLWEGELEGELFNLNSSSSSVMTNEKAVQITYRDDSSPIKVDSDIVIPQYEITEKSGSLVSYNVPEKPEPTKYDKRKVFDSGEFDSDKFKDDGAQSRSLRAQRLEFEQRRLDDEEMYMGLYYKKESKSEITTGLPNVIKLEFRFENEQEDFDLINELRTNRNNMIANNRRFKEIVNEHSTKQ